MPKRLNTALSLAALGFAGLGTADLIRSRGMREHTKYIDNINSTSDSTNYPVPNRIHSTSVQRLAVDSSNKDVYTLLHRDGNQAFIVAPNTAHPIAIEHELGHVKAKYHEKHPGIAARAVSIVHKPTFKATKIRNEEEAWSYVHPSREKHVLKQHALGAYDKEFHRKRGLAAVAAAVLAASPLVARKFIK